MSGLTFLSSRSESSQPFRVFGGPNHAIGKPK
jgi:hypothetical protein